MFLTPPSTTYAPCFPMPFPLQPLLPSCPFPTLPLLLCQQLLSLLQSEAWSAVPVHGHSSGVALLLHDWTGLVLHASGLSGNRACWHRNKGKWWRKEQQWPQSIGEETGGSLIMQGEEVAWVQLGENGDRGRDEGDRQQLWMWPQPGVGNRARDIAVTWSHM